MKYIKLINEHTNQNIEVVIVDNNEGEGDWTGIYINGKIFTQGHSLRNSDILQALGVKYETISLNDQEIEHLGWNLPTSLDEVKNEYKKRG